MAPPVFNARHPQRGCRAAAALAFGLIACFVSGESSLEETACEQLPEARRELCLKVMRCMAVDDDEVRRACIDAAQLQPTPAIEQPPSREREPAHQEQQTLDERLIEPVVSPRVQREARQEIGTDRVPTPSRPVPPQEFKGTVSRVYQSILDRQLIAVDAQYLFESDRAAHARLQAGERVDVVKMSSRFMAGRRWRIVGPSRTPIVAFRIHCESPDIRSDDRRKCTQMLDR